MISKPWLLPDGVEEILAQQAQQVEHLRRHILDLYRVWGYELVIPPLLEFSESLLIGLGSDMQQQTLQFGDPMSARLLALRADITPQTSRIDAHRLKHNPTQVNRLCYVGTAVKSRITHGDDSRTPIYAGAELYGDASLDADCEVILLMLESLSQVGLKELHLDLGHVDVFRALVEEAQLNEQEEKQLFDAIQRKAQQDIDNCLAAMDIKPETAQCLSELAALHGDIECLERAKSVLKNAPQRAQQAIDDLLTVANTIKHRTQDKQLTFYFDLSELRAYHYHSGLIFSAQIPGLGRAIAKGGRYDQLGELFGRERAATGFQIELKSLANQVEINTPASDAIVALDNTSHAQDASLWQAVQQLRNAGEVVICTREQNDFEQAARRLVKADDGWSVQS